MRRLEEQSRELLGAFPVPVGLHGGAPGMGMGSLAHGLHCPRYDPEGYVGRTGLPALDQLRGAGGDRDMGNPRVLAPSLGSQGRLSHGHARRRG